MNHVGGCPKLPKQMKVAVCAMDDLPCYVEGQILDCHNYVDNEIDSEEEEVSENVNPFTESDMLLDGIREDVHLSHRSSSSHLSDFQGSDSLRQDSHYLAESPKPSEESDNLKARDSFGCHQRHDAGSSIRPSPSRCTVTDSLLASPKGTSKTSPHREEIPCRCIRQSDVRRRSSPLKSLNNDEVLTDSQQISPVGGSITTSFHSDGRPLTCLGGSDCSASRQPSPQRSLMKEIQMIDLSTPSSHMIRKCNKRTKLSSEVIDLTDSPIVIQL